LFEMTAQPAHPLTVVDPDEDWRQAHAGLLRCMGLFSLAAAEALSAQVVAAAARPGGTQGLGYDPGLALPRLARMLRLTLAMEADVRTDRLGQIEAADAAASAQAAKEAQARAEAERPAADKRQALREAVELAIDPDGDDEAPGADGRDVERRDSLRADLYERLADWDDADLIARPVGELAVQVCHELAIAFDPYLWDEEEWAIEEAEEGRPVRLYIRAAANGGPPRAPGRPP
jgi:hypothetical protein